MDILNHIIQKFYQCGSRLFVGGWYSYNYQFNMKEDRAEWKDNLRCLLLKYIYKLKYLKIIKYGVLSQAVMEDFIFNGVIVNHGDTIKRKIPLFKLILIKSKLQSYMKMELFFLINLCIYSISEEDKFINYLEDFSYL
jgi:hypothetical protein